MTVAIGGEEHHREPGPPRSQQEERVADAGRVAQDQGALAQVIQDAGGEDDQQPGAPDRRAAEVSHVRVQRLGSGDGQDDGGQGEERGVEVAEQEADRVAGRQRLQDHRVRGDGPHAEHADHGEPDAHDRPEHSPHGARAQPLNQEQDDDDRHRDGDDQIGHRRCRDLDALDRRKHRDGRRDHAVAEEQRGPEDPQRRQHRLGPDSAGQGPPADQGDQRHDPALAVVVGPHHEQDVRDGDDDRHRPEDQRDDPENGVVRHLDRVRIARTEDRLDGVQRARPDVPEDNSESTNRESPLAGSVSVHAHSVLHARVPRRVLLARGAVDAHRPGADASR